MENPVSSNGKTRRWKDLGYKFLAMLELLCHLVLMHKVYTVVFYFNEFSSCQWRNRFCLSNFCSITGIGYRYRLPLSINKRKMCDAMVIKSGSLNHGHAWHFLGIIYFFFRNNRSRMITSQGWYYYVKCPVLMDCVIFYFMVLHPVHESNIQ